MAIRPILFNGEMVRAILDGRKTCTRRIVKTRRKDACGFYVTKSPDGSFTGVYEYDEDERMFENPLFPPYKPGDILYVRETWDWDPDNEVAKPYYYKADGDLRPEGYKGMGWSPSIHMPKEAARIWLRVTNVRVERLQDITDNEAEAEGFTDYTSTALGFAYTWDHTIKKSDFDRYGWAANPWVWVIQFERCEKPER